MRKGKKNKRHELIIRTQTAINLVREKGINGCILNLLGSEPGIVPPTPGDPLGLGNFQAQHAEAQRLEPGPFQLKVAKPLRSEGAKVTNIDHVKIIIFQKLLHVFSDPNPNDSDVGVRRRRERLGWKGTEV